MNDVAIYDASGHLNDLMSESMGRETGGILPPIHSGDEGDVLTVKDGVASWEPVPEELPEITTPGDIGKVLTVDAEGEPSWESAPRELPTIHEDDVGKALVVGNLGVEWDTFPKELPAVTTSDSGKVLTVQVADNVASWGVADVPKELPTVTTADRGKYLKVFNNGTWGAGTDIVYSKSYLLSDSGTGDIPSTGRTINPPSTFASGQTFFSDFSALITNGYNVIFDIGTMAGVWGVKHSLHYSHTSGTNIWFSNIESDNNGIYVVSLKMDATNYTMTAYRKQLSTT